MTIPVGEPVELDIWKGHNTQRFPSICDQSCYNLFDFPYNGGQALMPTPGHEILFEIDANGQWRGIFSSNLLNSALIVTGKLK